MNSMASGWLISYHMSYAAVSLPPKTSSALFKIPAVIVSHSSNNRMQRFTSHGKYVTQWGSTGAGNGQLNAI